MQTIDSDHLNITGTHNNVGEVHRKKVDYARALESYEKALMVFKKAYGEDDLHIARCLNNTSIIFHNKAKFSELYDC